MLFHHIGNKFIGIIKTTQILIIDARNIHYLSQSSILFQNTLQIRQELITQKHAVRVNRIVFYMYVSISYGAFQNRGIHFYFRLILFQIGLSGLRGNIQTSLVQKPVWQDIRRNQITQQVRRSNKAYIGTNITIEIVLKISLRINIQRIRNKYPCVHVEFTYRKFSPGHIAHFKF